MTEPQQGLLQNVEQVIGQVIGKDKVTVPHRPRHPIEDTEEWRRLEAEFNQVGVSND